MKIEIDINEPLEVRQANEKYLMNVKHEEETLCENLQKHPTSWDSLERLEDLIKLRLNTPLYFSFGKYKGRIVQDILQQDRDYCDWFLDNIRGTDFNTLKILDYLYKKLHHIDYWLGSVQDEIFRVKLEYPKLEKHQEKLKEFFSYKKKKHYGGYNSSDFDCGYMTDWEEQMTDVIDYGDLT